MSADYFCYISRNKVDQLIQNISEEYGDEWIESKTTENQIGANAESDWSIGNLLKLFKGGITYGRKGVIQYERKIKIHYAEKLKKVLIALAKEKPIPSLTKAIDKSRFNALYYYHDDDFKFESKSFGSESTITIHTTIGDKTLYLDCSVRYFSEVDETGNLVVHSSNARFFSGELDLHFETIFILLGKTENKIYGSPLF